MQLINKNLKYNKTFIYIKKKKKINTLNFGNFGLKVLKSFIINLTHLKLLQKYLKKKIKKLGKFWIKNFPNFSITKKGLGTRMGGGKGKLDNRGIYLREGSIFLELYIQNQKKEIANKILLYCVKKLPAKLKIISKLFL